MRLAIMQPYLLPYIGYFQLINAVEKFVIYDDVNFIKQGWINRNGKDHIFTLKLNGASSFKRINQIDILNSKEKILKTVSQSYRKAPFYEQTMPLIQKIFSKQENNLASFLIFSLLEILKSLNIDTPIVKSSEIAKTNLLKGQDKIIYICKLLDATVYINAIGGQGLYNREAFQKNNIKLQFIKSRDINYEQFNSFFIPWLSIIDVLMFNSLETIQEMLREYDLV